MRAVVAGFIFAVMPAVAQEPEVVPVPTGSAACDPNGPNCIVSRATLIASNIALEIAAQRIRQLDGEVKAKNEAIDGLRIDLEYERTHGPRCAKVEKIPVPGTRS